MESQSVLDYIFAFILGLYFGSTILFILMGLYKKIKKRKWMKPVVRPAFISGFMWGIGYVGLIYSMEHLSYSVVFVTSQIGSIGVSSCWSLFYFHEITQMQSQVLLLCALTLMLFGIVSVAIAG